MSASRRGLSGDEDDVRRPHYGPSDVVDVVGAAGVVVDVVDIVGAADAWRLHADAIFANYTSSQDP